MHHRFFDSHGSHGTYQFVRFYQFLLSASTVPVLAIIRIPGTLGLRPPPTPEGGGSITSHGVQGHVRKCYLYLFRHNMGGTSDMVGYMAGVSYGDTVMCYFIRLPSRAA